MRGTLIITGLMLALAAVTKCKGAEQKAAYTVIIANDWIEVRSAEETPRTFNKMLIEDWAAMLGYSIPLSFDDVRHLALNAVAAVVVGNGRRKHIVDPDQQIITYDESGQSAPVTLTMELGIGFAILRDSPPTTIHAYRADIMVIDAKTMEKAFQMVTI